MTILITERLVLRPLRRSDAEALTSQINNFEVSKNLARVPYPYVLSDALGFLDWVKTFDNRSLFAAITEKQNADHPIGVISYEYAEQHDNAELGYWLAEAYWNQGYMRETAGAVVDHAFNTTELNLMVSCFFNENPNSGKILQGVGFEERNQCTSFSKAQGKDVPVTNMRLTRERWAEMKKRKKETPIP
jgi:[ribosomal protein S5]-alanine N-acetyltransferase